MSLNRPNWKSQWILCSFLVPPNPHAEGLTHYIVAHQILTTLEIPILQKRKWRLWNGTHGTSGHPANKMRCHHLERKCASEGQLPMLSNCLLGDAEDSGNWGLRIEWILETTQSWDFQTSLHRTSGLGLSMGQNGTKGIGRAHSFETTDFSPDWSFPDGETEVQKGYWIVSSHMAYQLWREVFGPVFLLPH